MFAIVSGMWEITFYQNGRGDSLVYDFLVAKDRAVWSKSGRSFDAMRKYGPDLGMPYSRYLGGGLYELRIRAKNEVRIFYCVANKEKTIILLHAFKKRTQKIPLKELEIARRRQKELTDL